MYVPARRLNIQLWSFRSDKVMLRKKEETSVSIVISRQLVDEEKVDSEWCLYKFLIKINLQKKQTNLYELRNGNTKKVEFLSLSTTSSCTRHRKRRGHCSRWTSSTIRVIPVFLLVLLLYSATKSFSSVSKANDQHFELWSLNRGYWPGSRNIIWIYNNVEITKID